MERDDEKENAEFAKKCKTDVKKMGTQTTLYLKEGIGEDEAVKNEVLVTKVEDLNEPNPLVKLGLGKRIISFRAKSKDEVLKEKWPVIFTSGGYSKYKGCNSYNILLDYIKSKKRPEVCELIEQKKGMNLFFDVDCKKENELEEIVIKLYEKVNDFFKGYKIKYNVCESHRPTKKSLHIVVRISDDEFDYMFFESSSLKLFVEKLNIAEKNIVDLSVYKSSGLFRSIYSTALKKNIPFKKDLSLSTSPFEEIESFVGFCGLKKRDIFYIINKNRQLKSDKIVEDVENARFMIKKELEGKSFEEQSDKQEYFGLNGNKNEEEFMELNELFTEDYQLIKFDQKEDLNTFDPEESANNKNLIKDEFIPSSPCKETKTIDVKDISVLKKRIITERIKENILGLVKGVFSDSFYAIKFPVNNNELYTACYKGLCPLTGKKHESNNNKVKIGRDFILISCFSENECLNKIPLKFATKTVLAEDFLLFFPKKGTTINASVYADLMLEFVQKLFDPEIKMFNIYESVIFTEVVSFGFLNRNEIGKSFTTNKEAALHIISPESGYTIISCLRILTIKDFRTQLYAFVYSPLCKTEKAVAKLNYFIDSRMQSKDLKNEEKILTLEHQALMLTKSKMKNIFEKNKLFKHFVLSITNMLPGSIALMFLTLVNQNVFSYNNAIYIYTKDNIWLCLAKEKMIIQITINLIPFLNYCMKVAFENAFTLLGNEIEKLIKKFNNNSFCFNIYSFVLGLCEEKKDLNENPLIIAFKNGIFDIGTKEFRIPLKSDFIINTINYDYDPLITTDIAFNFVSSFLSNTEDVHALLWFLASALDSRIPNDKFTFLTGNGCNGKTCLLSLISLCFDRYHCSFEANLFFKYNENPSNPRPELESILNANIATSSELPMKTKTFNAEILKKFCGGADYITYRPLYGKTKTVKLKTKFILACNDLPSIEMDAAVSRRMNIIDFNLKFVENPVHEYERKKIKNFEDFISTNITLRQSLFNLLLTYLNTPEPKKSERNEELNLKITSNYIDLSPETIKEILMNVIIKDSKKQLRIQDILKLFQNKTKKVFSNLEKIKVEHIIKEFVSFQYPDIERKKGRDPEHPELGVRMGWKGLGLKEMIDVEE